MLPAFRSYVVEDLLMDVNEYSSSKELVMLHGLTSSSILAIAVLANVILAEALVMIHSGVISKFVVPATPRVMIDTCAALLDCVPLSHYQINLFVALQAFRTQRAQNIFRVVGLGRELVALAHDLMLLYLHVAILLLFLHLSFHCPWTLMMIS